MHLVTSLRTAVVLSKLTQQEGSNTVGMCAQSLPFWPLGQTDLVITTPRGKVRAQNLQPPRLQRRRSAAPALLARRERSWYKFLRKY